MNREIKFRVWSKHNHTMDYDTGHKVDKDLFELMQFTGLKDKNGVEIYEGDILQHHGIVAWNDSPDNLCWSRIDLNWNDRREWYSLNGLTSPLIIIGNIYENPELLK